LALFATGGDLWRSQFADADIVIALGGGGLVPQTMQMVGRFNVTGNGRASRIDVHLTKVGLNYHFNA
jgi:hypothetical protein